jgi:hypothetical protein
VILRDAEHVRKWRTERLKAGPKCAKPFGPVTVAKRYRLLRAILNTAVRDKRLNWPSSTVYGRTHRSGALARADGETV